MKLIKKIAQHRRDFQGEYKCEFCGHTQRDNNMSSYDDSFFHTEIIPNLKCLVCGASTVSKGGTATPAATKYPDGMQL